MAEAKKPVIAACAEGIAVQASGAAGVGFDPSIIIAIITAIIQALGGCKKTPAQAASAMRNPNLLARFVVRRECRRHVDDRDECDCLVEAVLDAGSTIDADQAKAMLSEAK